MGSCWGAQLAAVAAGGKCEANPKGREFGVGRKILLTTEGRSHPMYDGKHGVFDAFESHGDIITQLPEGGVLLAGNAFSPVQALDVTHLNGRFWAFQYHPEYDFAEIGALAIVRKGDLSDEKLLAQYREAIGVERSAAEALIDDVIDPRETAAKIACHFHHSLGRHNRERAELKQKKHHRL